MLIQRRIKSPLERFYKLLDSGNSTFCNAVYTSALLLARSLHFKLAEEYRPLFALFPISNDLSHLGPIIFNQNEIDVLTFNGSSSDKIISLQKFSDRVSSLIDKFQYPAIVFLDQFNSDLLPDQLTLETKTQAK